MCYFSRLFVIQLKIKIPQTNNCNFDCYVTLNFIEYILWIKHKPQIRYQYILLVDSTFYHILFSDSSECRNNKYKDQFVCCLPVIICSEGVTSNPHDTIEELSLVYQSLYDMSYYCQLWHAHYLGNVTSCQEKSFCLGQWFHLKPASVRSLGCITLSL